MRGGERWPGNDFASEMRREGPAVQAALVLACRYRTPRPFDGQANGDPSKIAGQAGARTVESHARPYEEA